MNNSSLLIRESPKVWILNANLEVMNGSQFYITSGDIGWLKINSTGGIVHEIKSHGNLIIDSVKITSWDTSKNDYANTDMNGTILRSYILSNYGSGRVIITNSELGYLGYNYPSNFGLTYYTGNGSEIKNNEIHDFYYGFYSDNHAHDIMIDSNEFYNNTVYGIYPHSGTHHIVIINNKVHNNGKHGIICSTDCYNIIIDSYKVYNNNQEGIMLYKNVSNSVIRNNVVYNNRDAIAIYDSSNNNKVYNNTIINGKVGIRVINNSSQNLFKNNSMLNSDYGIYVLRGASNNEIDYNRIANTSSFAILVQDPGTGNNIFSNNIFSDNKKNEISQSNLGSSKVLIINNTIPYTNTIN